MTNNKLKKMQCSDALQYTKYILSNSFSINEIKNNMRFEYEKEIKNKFNEKNN